jgi:hypothetical protein
MNLPKILLLQLYLFAISVNIIAQDNKKTHSIFRDSLDNAIDISDWLVNKKGVIVVPTIITEPAVDYGAAAGILYFHSSYSRKKGPPSVSGVIGGATLNGTWLAGAFHAGYWKRDRIRYLGAIAKTYANLGFYGSGNLETTSEAPINLNLDAWILLQQIKFRLGKTNLFLGGKYTLLDTYNTFEINLNVPEMPATEFSSTLSEVAVIFDLDSRNNVFTPSKGVFLELSGTYSDTWLGGDALYGRMGVTLIGYFPAGKKVVTGIRSESNFTFGDIPYYARPIINMRGAPLMKYQNTNTMLLEAEVNWNVYKRWYLSGFTGIGNAFSSFDDLNNGKSVATLGTGFRYLLARKLGMNMGADFAVSPGDFAFYIVLGSAWMK